MKTLTQLSLVAACLITLTAANELSAKDFGKVLKQQVVRHVKRELHHTQPVRQPRCEPGRPCPPPHPYAQPQPIVCHYFFGVWTTPVQIAPPSGPLAALTSGPTTRIVPGSAQPTLGLRIDRVVEHSPACQAGFEADDVLLTANGRQLHDKHDLHAAIQHCGGQLECLVLDGRTGQVSTVVAYPERR